MSDLFEPAATALRHAAGVLRERARWLPSHHPGPAAFGGSGPGRLGALGRQLHAQLAQALDARATEAAQHADRLDGLADHVVQAAHRYAETDEAALRGSGPVA